MSSDPLHSQALDQRLSPFSQTIQHISKSNVFFSLKQKNKTPQRFEHLAVKKQVFPKKKRLASAELMKIGQVPALATIQPRTYEDDDIILTPSQLN